MQSSTPDPLAVTDLINQHRSGHGLPRDLYLDETVYVEEMDAIWRRDWVFAGVGSQIPERGDYFTYDLVGNSVIVIRKDDGTIAAHHNVCRHRGSVIATHETGRARRLVCPYHQWTYGQDGSLLRCSNMPDDLDKSALGLRPVHVRDVEGLIFVCLAEDAPAFDEALNLMGPMARPQGFGSAKIAKMVDYDVPANWKLIWENNRECYHCDSNHPQYVIANFDRYDAAELSEEIERLMEEATRQSEEKWAASGLAVTFGSGGLAEFPDPGGKVWYSANRTALVPGYVTESMDGQRVAPLMGSYTDSDVGTLRLRTVPNFWQHGSCDHAVVTRLTPNGPGSTKVRVMWLVDKDAEEGRDYDLDNLLPFWKLTSEQDWTICERQQKGVQSSAFVPGPLSPDKEYNVMAFHRWYIRRMAGYAEAVIGPKAAEPSMVSVVAQGQ